MAHENIYKEASDFFTGGLDILGDETRVIK